MNTFKTLGIKTESSGLIGKKIEMDDVFDNNIKVEAYEIRDSKYPRKPGEKCTYMQIELNGNKRVCFTTSIVLMNTLERVSKDKFPILTRIVRNKSNKSFEFVEPTDN